MFFIVWWFYSLSEFYQKMCTFNEAKWSRRTHQLSVKTNVTVPEDSEPQSQEPNIYRVMDFMFRRKVA